ncbi:uncharacterized protein LOC143590650 [Bidens hawaiensis]|uniref:uncharacterized protein LOC143590650 n=1 Tax=Bidens hawaiensis TaxID=980011 RepID=UPI0040496692
MGDTASFSVEIAFIKVSALSPFLFEVVLDELSKSIQEIISWCMIFVDDIMIVADSKQDLNRRLEEWRVALERKGLSISRSKTEYLHCDLSGANGNEEIKITIKGQVVPQTTKFKYLGLFFQSDGGINSEVTHHVHVGWCRRRAAIQLN